MTLAEALALTRQPRTKSRQRRLLLVCGFESLHLGTFLRGHFIQRFSDEDAAIATGVYGDLEGTLVAAAGSAAEGAAVVLEWADVDSRLGLRSAGGWSLSIQPDILASCRSRLDRVLAGLRVLCARMPVVLVAPTLPIPLFGHTAGRNAGANELTLQRDLAIFLAEAATVPGVSIVSPARLADLSPSVSRADVFMELKAGFPYTLGHAAVVAEQMIQTLFPPLPMKGLITDLDHTLWAGIVGEVGMDRVSWSLEDHSQIHGLYQQLLSHFSEMGVLLAVASKNEQSVAEAALRRADLRVSGTKFYPVRADWGPKSRHIGEILRTWNIGAQNVVFVDESPLELEEARTAFPGLTTRQFPKHPGKAVALFAELRDMFGKPSVGQEDALRQASIRAAAVFQQSADAPDSGNFVRGLEGLVTFDLKRNSANLRPLELVNKTNQFNLNGVRVTEGEWMRQVTDRSSFALQVNYEDKFGPLGMIGVLAGQQNGEQLEVTSWVLSCRAFSRKIEHHTLDFVFQHFSPAAITLRYQATERNQPLQQFLKSIGAEEAAVPETTLTREKFYSRVDDLPHKVRIQ